MNVWDRLVITQATTLAKMGTLLMLCALAFTPASAHALIIDSFEEGAFSTGGFAEQAGLSTSNVVGGVRFVTLSIGGMSSLSLSAGDDANRLENLSNENQLQNLFYDGIPGGPSNSGSSGALNLDLSSFDRVVLEISATSDASVGFNLRIYDSTTDVFVQLGVNGPGSYSFPLSAFAGVDLSDVRAIHLQTFGLDMGNFIDISNLAAVPEPSTGLLLAAGLLALRRHSRASC